jgi:hypothetical protein
MFADEDTPLSSRLRQLVGELRAEWRELNARTEALNGEFIGLARNDAAVRRLTSIPGIGVLNATALIAAVGKASSFAKARDLGAWRGLVPRQHTTGGKPGLLGISKSGNTYLQTLLIHGARAVLPSLARSGTPFQNTHRSAPFLFKHRHHNQCRGKGAGHPIRTAPRSRRRTCALSPAPAIPRSGPSAPSRKTFRPPPTSSECRTRRVRPRRRSRPSDPA